MMRDVEAITATAVDAVRRIGEHARDEVEQHRAQIDHLKAVVADLQAKLNLVDQRGAPSAAVVGDAGPGPIPVSGPASPSIPSLKIAAAIAVVAIERVLRDYDDELRLAVALGPAAAELREALGQPRSPPPLNDNEPQHTAAQGDE